MIFVTFVSQTSVKNFVYVLTGYVVPVLQNGALKWKKKLTGVRSRAVTSDRTLKLKICEEITQPKFMMLYMKCAGIVYWIAARCDGGHLISAKIG